MNRGFIMEYKKFAKYYDQFYQKKNYEKEVLFIEKFLSLSSKILDVGCGTGIHASILEKDGYLVDGMDLNQEMLDVAKRRVHGNLFLGNVLDMHLNTKYDVIISMFAVMNHLKNTEELELALKNMSNILNEHGKILLDFHNPQASGKKIDTYNNMERVMEWEFNPDTKIEESTITFQINGNCYHDSHTFRIFTIDEVKLCCSHVGLKVMQVFENYQVDKEGCSTSKNLQFYIEKE